MDWGPNLELSCQLLTRMGTACPAVLWAVPSCPSQAHSELLFWASPGVGHSPHPTCVELWSTGLISTSSKDCSTAVDRCSNLCLAAGEKAGWQFLAASAKHSEPTNSEQALSAAVYHSAAHPGCGRARKANSSGLSLHHLFLPASGPWHCPGDRSKWQGRSWMQKIQDPAEETQKFSCCGCASPLIKEGRNCDWQAAKSIFGGDIIASNDHQPQQ